MPRGCYIVFEGVVGSGKTTQSKKLVEILKQRLPGREVIWTREPGGSVLADAIRALAQGTFTAEAMEPIAEAYLFAASRAQTLRSVVKPAVERGAIVIADRSFVSSLAFQGGGRALGIDKVLEVNRVAIERCLPDLVLYLDVSLDVALRRTSDLQGDKFESMPSEFFHKVMTAYIQASKLDLLKDRWRNVDGTGYPDEVFKRIETAVEQCF
jgi:dTMP kinase